MRPIVFSICSVLTALAAGAEWSRGVDQAAMGTFWQPGREVLGMALTVKLKPNAWPELALRGTELGFGEVRLPGDGPVKATLVSADWCAARCRFESAAGALELWVSNLSPAVLIRTDARKIALFAGAAPTQTRAPLSEPFALVSFHKAKGFSDGQIPAVHGTPAVVGVDAPMLITLQTRLKGVGHHGAVVLDFGEKPAGVMQVMPLFGARKLRGSETGAWKEELPAEVRERCRRLVRMSRFFPVACKEEYRLGADGSVSVRQGFDCEEIKDDWGTKGEKLAPLPPALGIALAFAGKGPLPIEVAPAPTDLSYPTVNGPLLACEGDSHTLRFPGGRRYVDEVLEITPGDDPISKEALAKLNAQVEKILKSDKPFRWLSSSSNYQFFRFGARNEQLFSLCQSLPLLKPELRQEAKARAKAMLGEVLAEANFLKETVRTPSGQVAVLRPKSERSISGVWESEDLYNGIALSAVWAYAHYTGDLDAVKPNRAFLDAMANHVLTRHNWLLGFAVEGWATTGFCHTAQVNALIAYARLMKALGDEAAYGKAAYLVAKHLVGWYAHFFGTDYIASYMGRDHTSGANRFRHLTGVLPDHLARKTDIIYDTKVNWWITTHGPGPEGDPTLFLAPWTGIFPLARDEMHRFWRDHMKGEVAVVWDFFTWLWPETFNQFSQDQMNNWGGITPYYQVKAFVLDGTPEWLLENLPWPEVTQDPFYLQNLRAILVAAGQSRWAPLSQRH
ncbi:MAG TPA: hypothetical protein PLE19_01005 [Planctomycetota bacterium]|nr:hypothetical protein [Planctomycetota bacterium]HRR80664.1 hypothetical protein [Planctomycetota bacterium]HRT93252.1 hypothetical protein [Planctomycetota bacterium]